MGNEAAKSVNELEAYVKEYSNRTKNNLNADQIKRIEEQIYINHEFLKRTQSPYLNRVDKGNYQLFINDRCSKSECFIQ